MSINNRRKQQAMTIRIMRKIHRTAGILLFVFFFVVGVTGVMLGWKKHSSGYLLPHTIKGSTTDVDNWMSLKDLEVKAFDVLKDSIYPDLSTKISRIDVRSRKGVVKFVFADHYYEVQLDGATGKLLQIGERRSDVIEDIHDGTIVDDFFHCGGYFKLFYTSIMGVALLVFCVSGFWLWYGPKRMRII